MTSLPKNVLYYGDEASLPERVHLRAGPLSLIYVAGDLRYIRLGNREIVRRIYVAARDRNWGTVPTRISNLQMTSTESAFQISYDAENREGDIDFVWHTTITGDAAGTLTFTMDGVARSTFWRNRIGFCVLHPMACAGETCTVENVDGTVENSAFPRHIAPHQPFMAMRALTHTVAPGLRAEVRFDGDTFETEDQRNWTDASYKTYSTPLAIPFPVHIQAGTRIRQTITLRLHGDVPVQQDTAEKDIVVHVGETPAWLLPHIGLGIASHGQPLSQREIARLRTLHLSHLRVDLDLSTADHIAKLRQAAEEARALDASLEIALFLSDKAEVELAALAAMLTEITPPVCMWLIFHHSEKATAAKWVAMARRILENYDPTAKFGSGTNAYCTELNRERPTLDGLDLVSYSLNPQVHAFDNASLVETLATQAETVSSARQFVGETPIAVSPVTLKPRFNPNATGPATQPAPGELPSQVDVRQMSLLGAGWTLGSLKYLSESGVYSATYFETSGWRGVMETEAGSPLPEKFRSLPGAVFPMYHVLADVGEFAGGDVLPTRTTAPLTAEAFAVRRDGHTRILVANLTAEPQTVTVQGVEPSARVRVLDKTNAEAAMTSPETFRAQASDIHHTTNGQLNLNLLPYAIARLDTTL